jgi:YD repeat-containing protein
MARGYYYQRTSPGTDQVGAVMEHTGTVDSPATPTGFYASVLRWNAARPGWDITFTDGTIYLRPGRSSRQPAHWHPGSVGNPHCEPLRHAWGSSSARITSPWALGDFVNGDVGLVMQIRDNLGRTVSYTYDAQFRLTTVTDAGGGVTQYSYHPLGAQYALIQTITDARNITYLTNAWDLQNRRVVSQTQPDGTTFQFAYTVGGQGKITQTDMTDPRGPCAG